MVLGGMSNDDCDSGAVAPRAETREGGNAPGGLRDGRGGAGTLGFGRGTIGAGVPTSADTDAASAGGAGCEPGGWAFSVDGVSLIRRALHAEIDP